MIPVFKGTIDAKRKVIFADKNALLIYCAKFKEGQEVEVIIRRKKSKRSLNQNAYYWMICTTIADSSGYESPDEVHEALKMMYLRVNRTGLPDTIRSTTDLNTAEFAEYIDKIKRDAARGVFGGENGIYIPDAGEFIL
jgi:hypothetical protein